MGRKSRDKLHRQRKREQLEQITRATPLTPPLERVETLVDTGVSKVSNQPNVAPTHNFQLDIRKTGGSFILATLLLVLAVVVHDRTNWLQNIGDQLYSWLRLNG